MDRMRRQSILCSATILLAIASAPNPAAALSAGDVIDKMSNAEQTAYMFGSAEMAAFLAHASGNTTRAQCITDWFHQHGVSQITQTMSAMKDRQAQPIIFTLIKRACGE
jgi:hypothetical protein